MERESTLFCWGPFSIVNWSSSGQRSCGSYALRGLKPCTLDTVTRCQQQGLCCLLLNPLPRCDSVILMCWENLFKESQPDVTERIAVVVLAVGPLRMSTGETDPK